MITRRLWIALAAAAALGGAAPASAKVDVIAATQDLAWVTKAVGGTNVNVDYLAGSSQDPHMIEPRPSQVVKIARADMVVRVGMDLDLWFQSLVQASGNRKVLFGANGYVDASRNVPRLQVPQGKVDPSQGDIHIYGNPHYLFGPQNLRIVARNIADGLRRVDIANAAAYEAGYNALVQRVNEAMKGWSAKLAKDRGKKVVTYHTSLIYFLNEFGLSEYGNVEPRPGLEPTPGHVASLAKRMKADGVNVIVAENWRGKRYTNLLASQSGAKVVIVPGGVGAEKGVDDYFALISAFVDRISTAL